MEHLSEKKKVTVVIALMVVMFFAAINQTLVSNSMPRIIAILGGMDHYSWVMTAYMLASCIATVLVGKLSDIYGRKPFLLVGIIVFMIGTFLCGLSKDIFQMITFRAVQGAGAGILMSSTITAVGDLFAPRERAKWTGTMMAVFGFSSVVGPTLGGFMIDHMEWKWLFWTFLPLGIVAFLLIWRLFPQVKRDYDQAIDYWGSLFLSLSIVALLLAFSWAGTKYPWGSIEILGLFAMSVICAGILVMIESKVKNPVLPLSLFKNGIVTISNLIGFLMNAAMMGTMMYLPFFLQGVEGLSPSQSGLINIPMSLSMVVFSSLVGVWISKTGKYKRYAFLGVGVMFLGMVLMVFMDDVILAVISTCVFGLGLGLCTPVFTLAAQNAVPASQLGVVTATSTLFRNLGGTIGIAVFGSVMSSAFTRKMEAQIQASGGLDLSNVDAETAQQLTGLLSPEILLDQPKLKTLGETLPTQVQDVFLQMIELLRTVLHESIAIVFISGSALLVVAGILVIFLKEIPLRSSQQKTTES